MPGAPNIMNGIVVRTAIEVMQRETYFMLDERREIGQTGMETTTKQRNALVPREDSTSMRFGGGKEERYEGEDRRKQSKRVDTSITKKTYR